MDNSLDNAWWLEMEIMGAQKRDANLTELDKLIEGQEARIAHIRHYSKRSPIPPDYAEEIARIQAFKGQFEVGDRLIFWERYTTFDGKAGYALYRNDVRIATLITKHYLSEEWQEDV